MQIKSRASKKNEQKFFVGQEVLVLHKFDAIKNEHPKKATVEKVGRKWVYLEFCYLGDKIKVNIDTMTSSDERSGYTVFLTQKDYDQHIERMAIIGYFRALFYNSRRVSLTIEQLRKMKEIATGKQ